METLQTIGIPQAVIKKKDKISTEVETTVTKARKADQKLKSLILESGELSK